MAVPRHCSPELHHSPLSSATLCPPILSPVSLLPSVGCFLTLPAFLPAVCSLYLSCYYGTVDMWVTTPFWFFTRFASLLPDSCPQLHPTLPICLFPMPVFSTCGLPVVYLLVGDLPPYLPACLACPCVPPNYGCQLFFPATHLLCCLLTLCSPSARLFLPLPFPTL